MKTSSPLVADYLARLDLLLGGIDPAERQDVLAGVSEHLEAALAATDGSEAATRGVLAELGSPEAVAEEAYAGRPPAATFRAPTSVLDRAWLPIVVVVLQTIALVVLIGFVAGSASVVETGSATTDSAGHTTYQTTQTWNGSVGPALAGLLITFWLWLPAWLLVGLTGLWTSREKVAQIALLPVAALALGGLPELGYRVWSFDGIPVGAWTGLGVAMIGGGVLLWKLTDRACERAAVRRP